MKFSVDHDGFLRTPSFHDGFVDGIRAVDKTATVSLRAFGGQSFSMQLVGVEALVCDDFRQGNIIFDVQIVSGISPNTDVLSRLFEPPHPDAAENFRKEHTEYVARQIDRIKERELKLVSIEPSYGCSLVALCHDVIID